MPSGRFTAVDTFALNVTIGRLNMQMEKIEYKKFRGTESPKLYPTCGIIYIIEKPV